MVLSPRLAALVDALPLRPGLRVLEIGCGPGAAARAVAERIGEGRVLAIDRSARAIAIASRLATDRLAFRCVAAEDFRLLPGEAPFDLAFAFRVGALDGRHPAAGALALPRIRAALAPGGQLFIDAGVGLRELPPE